MPYVNTSLPALVPASGGTFTGAITAPDYAASGLTGAVAASRYVGATATGAPASGTFAVGDFIIAENGHIFVCTVAGSPGTWVDVGGSGAPVSSVFTRTGAVVAATNDYNYSQIQASAAAVALSNLADPTTGKVVGSSANAAAAVFPPGYEFGYDQITSSINVVGTTQAGGTTIITCGAHTFDGAAVYCEFYAPQVTVSSVASNLLGVTLNESAAAICDLAAHRTGVATSPSSFVSIYAKFKFTPTAASHSYVITAYTASTTGTPSVGAGTGSAGATVPCFVRFTKV